VSERIRLPADVELEDRLAFGLTARQLVILAATAVVAYAVFAAAGSALPTVVAGILAAPFAFVGVTLALGRLDGLSGDRLALAAARHLAQPTRRVVAPEGVPARLPGPGVGPAVSLLQAPVVAIFASGVVELADGSFCLLCRATGTSWALRSEEEQQALVEAFGKWLNSLSEPAAITVRSEPVDVTERAGQLERATAGLPHPALRYCAETYARYLAQLGDEGLRRRQIVLVLSTRARECEAARGTLERRASEATGLLRAAGVELGALDGEHATVLLAGALDPPEPPAGCQLGGVIHRC
jgi:hypothetical protein